MNKGKRDDYTRVSWLLSQPITQYIGVVMITVLYGVAFASLLMPAAAFPFAPPLIIAGLALMWIGILMVVDVDGSNVVDRMSQTGWEKETTTHIHEKQELETKPCSDPDCDIDDIPGEAEIAERYSYDVLYIAGVEVVRKTNTQRYVCPDHADEDALDVDLYDPRNEQEESDASYHQPVGTRLFDKKMKRQLEKALRR